MLAQYIESFIDRFAMDSEVIAVLIQLTLGLAFAYLVGQIVAFNKFVQWRRPFLQVVGFVFGKSYSFLMATIKSLVFVLVAYFGLIMAGAFVGEDVMASQSVLVIGAYALSIVISLGIGYVQERKKVLTKNLLAGESERLQKESAPATHKPVTTEASLDL